MRKLFNFFAAALVMLAAASCEKNEVLPDNNSEGKIVTLKASINNGGTKTSLGQGVWEEGDPKVYPVLWSEGDAIAVIQSGIIYKSNLTGGANSTSGTFPLDETKTYSTPFNSTGEIKAFYPFNGVSLDGETIKYKVPATQTYTTTVLDEVAYSTFGKGASPMAAYRAAGATSVLTFDNLFGVLKLQLKGVEGEKVKTIEVLSKNIAISGNGSTVVIGPENSSIILPTVDNTTNRVILKCVNGGVGVDISSTTEFLISIPQAQNPHDFVVTIDTDKGVYYKETNQTIQSGNILKMEELDLEIFENKMSFVENGVYLGEGIARSDNQFVWAPVNCGYTNDNKYGLLYKFESNSGISYNGTIPTTISYGNLCPVGWRVPTKEELETLTLKTPNYLLEVDNAKGFNFYIDEAKTIFLPAAGMLHVQAGETPQFKYKDERCVYWSSTKQDYLNAYYLISSENKQSYSIVKNRKENAASVRCVRDVQ